MGDRCYLHVTMADADMERFGGLVGRIEDPLAERIDWHAAVADAVCARIR